MISQDSGTERIAAFSDAVFAVIITVLVLELRPPERATFDALRSLWPTAVSYAVSYLFIAIVWVNHHHLLGLGVPANSRLIWGNFAHLFSVSLIPFSTAWISDTRLAAEPVALYSAVFLLVNVTYSFLCWEVLGGLSVSAMSRRARRIMRVRAMLTILVFASAALVALVAPLGGMALICACLLLYLRPEAAVDLADRTTKGEHHE